jgi:hypothetical protein
MSDVIDFESKRLARAQKAFFDSLPGVERGVFIIKNMHDLEVIKVRMTRDKARFD